MPHAIPPLLVRSFQLVDALVADPLPRTWGQIRSRLKMGDASLTRLLGHLTAAGVLMKGRTQTYIPGPRLDRWKETLLMPAAPTAWDGRLTRLARETGLSCAVAVMDVNKILVQTSVSVPESVSVLAPGGLIHFERDHAAALAILSQVPPAAVRELIAGEFSTIPSMAVYRTALRKWKRPGYFLDRSRARPGVGRIAIPLPGEPHPSTLYVCGLRSDLITRRGKILRHMAAALK